MALVTAAVCSVCGNGFNMVVESNSAAFAPVCDECKQKYTLGGYQPFLVPMRTANNKSYLWFSVCSKHRSHNQDCDLCRAGSWVEIVIKDNSNDQSHN